MTETTVKIVFAIIAIMVMLFCVRRGYRRGISTEIRMFVSVLVATLCLVLIITLKHAVSDHTYGTVLVVGSALVVLGMGWRLIKLILSPLSGFKELKTVRTIDRLLGAVIGAAEGVTLLWIALKIYTLIQG